jgi:hypothetical protein
VGTPFIDFHYRDKVEDYNTRIINDADGRLSLVPREVAVNGSLRCSSSAVLLGSIELGSDGITPGSGTPYIDFHYRDKVEDYNTRIINDADGRLSIIAATFCTFGNVVHANGNVDIEKSLHVHGDITAMGDIAIQNADCAEEFAIKDVARIEPGTVMVLGDGGVLCQSTEAYDTKVAGVISGAGDLKPGLILDKHSAAPDRMPLALMGKVYCKVDAQYAPIAVGDLLTTSPTQGHAMKVTDPLRAFGAIIGKALRPLAAGTGLVPILVALQ